MSTYYAFKINVEFYFNDKYFSSVATNWFQFNILYE